MARLLLRNVCPGNDDTGQLPPAVRQNRAIGDWMCRAAFGQPVQEWLSTQLDALRRSGRPPSLRNLCCRLNDELDRRDVHGALSGLTKRYLREEVLRDFIPVLGLKHLRPLEQRQVGNLRVGDSAWPPLHMASLLLHMSASSLPNPTLNNLLAAGERLENMLFEALLGREPLDATMRICCRLPALFHFTLTHARAPTRAAADDARALLQDYLRHRWDARARHDDATTRLREQLGAWRTEAQLTRLAAAGHPQAPRGDGAALGFSVGQMFNAQNDLLVETFLKIDRLMMAQSIGALRRADRDFLCRANVRRVSAVHAAPQALDPFDLPHAMPQPAARAAPRCALPSQIDLLHAVHRGEARIYALIAPAATASNTYALRRVDNDSAALRSLMDRSTLPQERDACRVRWTDVGETLKASGQGFATLIRTLAGGHRMGLSHHLQRCGSDPALIGEADALLSGLTFWRAPFRDGSDCSAQLPEAGQVPSERDAHRNTREPNLAAQAADDPSRPVMEYIENVGAWLLSLSAGERPGVAALRQLAERLDRHGAVIARLATELEEQQRRDAAS